VLFLARVFAIVASMSTAFADTATDVAIDVAEVFVALLEAEVGCAERDDLAVLVKQVRQVRGTLDAIDLQIARRGQALAERDRPRPAPDAPPPKPDKGRDEASLIGLLLSSGVQSGKDAKATGARAGACTELPAFEAALAAGEISGAHLDVLARALRGLADAERLELRDRQDELLNRARTEFAEGFEKTLRNIVNEIRARHRPNTEAEELERQRRNSKISTWVDRDTGMHKTLIELDPLRQQEWALAMEAHLARLKADPAWRHKSFQELKVEAFVNAVGAPGAGAGDADQGPVRVPKAIIVIDLKTILDGPHAASIAELSNGTPIPIDTIRDMLAGSDIVPVLLSGEGQPLWVGRTRRVATEAQRDALTAIYRSCARNGCTRPVDATQAHHTITWRDEGPTDIDLLAPLCSGDHDAIHNGGFRLEIHDNHKTVTWHRPDGSVEYHGPPPGRRRPPP